MQQKKLFEQALGIEKPWFIESLNFDLSNKKLDIKINFEKGTKFFYESKTADISGFFSPHDTVEKSWRHLNFFQHDCYLTCRVPRVKLDTGKVRQIKTPWEGLNNGFTLLLEAFLLQLCKAMTIAEVSRLADIEEKRVWRMIDKYVKEATKGLDLSDVSKIGIDETSMKKGQDYVTLVVNLETNKTIFVTEGRSSDTIDKFKKSLEEQKGNANNILDISIDMSKAFIKGVKDNFPNGNITFDKFHLMKILGKAVGTVRKSEAKENDLLIGTKYLFDKNRKNLTEKQIIALAELELKKLNIKTVRALHLREAFQSIYLAETKEEFIRRLEAWYSWARRCRLQPMKNAAQSIKNHWDGVIQWFDSKINNGILEGLNSLIQAAKNKARGFRNVNYYRNIIFLVTGDLDFSKYNKFYKEL
jgi:transposase